MRRVAVIQARMGSTRLPGKVLADIGGRTMLGRVVARARRASTLDEVVVATSTLPEDEAVAREGARLGTSVFRGSEQDVLDRYHGAAREFRADVVVRITSDCPLIEPEVIDRVGTEFARAAVDYASNVTPQTYPRGLDVEVMTADALSRAWREAREPHQRVHVTPYIYQHPELFRLLPLVAERDYSGHRWTVDTPEDLAFVRAVYERLGDSDLVSWRDVLALLEREPELAGLNRHVRQKALEEG
jgi:spore coat polysaccharide biosynthesis protein SpsF (cytidylyltransferase family)